MKEPVPLVAKATVPVGKVALTDDVSVTVAVQLVELFTRTAAGLHVTVVVVLCPMKTAASSLVVRYAPLAPPMTYIRLFQLDIAAESSLRAVGNV